MTVIESEPRILDEMVSELIAMEGVEAFKFRVRGRSMEPTLHDGDSVTVAPLRKAPAIGDIVVFPQRSEIVVHRVVRVPKAADDSSRCIVTAGDGLGWHDQPVLLDKVLGVVREVRSADVRWSPDSPWRRFIGVARAVLATRPRLRRLVHRTRAGIRRFMSQPSRSGGTRI